MDLVRLPLPVTQLLVCIALLAASPDAAPGAEPDPPPAQRPPIPVRFRLDEPAFVTLVIERTAAVEPDSAGEKPDKAAGKLHYTGRHGLRVKNLVSNTWFPAGEHTVWWDGQDESNAHTIVIPGKAVYYRIDGSLVSRPVPGPRADAAGGGPEVRVRRVQRGPEPAVEDPEWPGRLAGGPYAARRRPVPAKFERRDGRWSERAAVESR